ncbi:unnamed protein product [Bursaphelenchus okinawaensis]|uniref:Uncharacterized protein n=1 Tax=Bursaphelenchus okinawaensis TaxID=465554 RepID=A0A811KD69_9BILA|nr:unnamed protein product [Bursaphelenchus okinawaensis]CAG9100865.1 unnamed protein product [Bursaphelenchus okinawaensis]
MRWQLLVVCLLSLLSLCLGGNASAVTVAKKLCPSCKKMENGMFTKYFLIYSTVNQEANGTYNQICDSSEDMKHGVWAWDKTEYWVKGCPVYTYGFGFDYYMINLARSEKYGMLQVSLPNGTFRYPVNETDKIDTEWKKPPSCQENTKYKYDKRVFLIYEYLILSPDEALNTHTFCSGTEKVNTSAYIDGLEDSEMDKAYVKEMIEECFSNSYSCVFDIVTKKILHGGYSDPVYAFDGLVVYTGCEFNRCIFMINDTLTETLWYIPDDVDFFKKKRQIHSLRQLVPLMNETDEFHSSPLRFKYTNITTTTTTTSTTSTTTTVTTTTSTSTAEPVVNTTPESDTTTAESVSEADEEDPTTEASEEEEGESDEQTTRNKRRETVNELGVMYLDAVGTVDVGFGTLLFMACLAVFYL